MDPGNAKGLYRRGISLLMLGEDVEEVLEVFGQLHGGGVDVPEDVEGLLVQAEMLQRLQVMLHDKANKRHSCSNNDGMSALLQTLEDEALDGGGDVDLVEVLGALESMLGSECPGDGNHHHHDGTSCGRQNNLLTDVVQHHLEFYARDGFRLLWFFFTEDLCDIVSRIMIDLGTTAVCWSSDSWIRLFDVACGKEGPKLAAQAMYVVKEVARLNVWVKNHRILRCMDDPFVARMLWCIGHDHLVSTQKIGPDAIVQACEILELFADGDSSGIVSIGHELITPLLHAFTNAKEIIEGIEDDGVRKAAQQQQPPGRDKTDEAIEDDEAKAKLELEKKIKAVYNMEVINFRKKLLLCLDRIVRSKSIVLNDLVVWRQGKKCAGQLHHSLISIAHDITDKCPKRTTKSFDTELRATVYVKKPFAADFEDNPTGDFLTRLDTQDVATVVFKHMDRRIPLAKLLEDNHSKDPLLHMYLDVLKTMLKHKSKTIAALMDSAGLLAVCAKLWKFVTPETIIRAQGLCSLLADANHASFKKIICEGHPIAASGLLLYSEERSNRIEAAREISLVIQTCNGDDFMALIDSDIGIIHYLMTSITKTETTLEDKKRYIYMFQMMAQRCMKHGLARALKNGRLIPKGHAWTSIDPSLIDDIIYDSSRFLADTKTRYEETTSDAAMWKGFLSSSTTHPANNTSSNTADKHQHHNKETKKRENPDPSPLKPETPIQQTDRDPIQEKDQGTCHPEASEVDTQGAIAVQNNKGQVTELTKSPQSDHSSNRDEDFDVVEVFDSTPAEHIRSSRMTWLAIPAKDRVRWEQTSQDVSIWLKLPKGTQPNELSVQVTSRDIHVFLKWYGRILDGDWFGKVKPSDMTWCIEDDEMHIAIAKDSTEHWWKTIIKGWEEKGYYELLQDAVNSDEPHTSYDDMDDSAKDLLDSILERQAYVNAGLLDLENGFDDFRIVLSDESLQPSSSKHQKNT